MVPNVLQNVLLGTLCFCKPLIISAMLCDKVPNVQFHVPLGTHVLCNSLLFYEIALRIKTLPMEAE